MLKTRICYGKKGVTQRWHVRSHSFLCSFPLKCTRSLWHASTNRIWQMWWDFNSLIRLHYKRFHFIRLKWKILLLTFKSKLTNLCHVYVAKQVLCKFNIYLNTSCEMPGWMKHKLESRLQGEILIITDMQMASPYGRKWRGTKKTLDEKWKKRVKKLA